jgi:hypothetical protein
MKTPWDGLGGCGGAPHRGDTGAAGKREDRVCRSHSGLCELVTELSHDTSARCPPPPWRLLGDGDLHVDSRLDGDAGDLLHHVSGRVQVDQALVDAQLEPVPRVGACQQEGKECNESDHTELR